MADVPDDLIFLQWLIDSCGIVRPKIIDHRRYAAVLPKLFTYAVVVGQIGDITGIDDHWCYDTRELALAALDAWDGVGEPKGWKRHPRTGRRISQSEDEIDEYGERVGEIGKLYVRG